MSGIVGIVQLDGAPADAALAARMTSAMPYRGPDGVGHWSGGAAALGQCMLRTTPESLEETQPLTSEDTGLVLVMDGRVDNREELRRELLGRGTNLRDRSDAELMLRAYAMWGAECLAHVEGDFALAIWDARRNRLFSARDRSGNRPFFYHRHGTTLAFASEARALLALPWVIRELNDGMLAEYLANEWHASDETFWKYVMRLPPAHRLETDAAGVRTARYWEPNLFAVLPYTREDDYIDHYRRLFEGIVRRMSRASGPVAFEVSGGLDSSAIFAMAESLRRKGELPAPEIHGYTLDFSGEPDADEMTYARAVGQHLGVRISEIAPSERPLEWYREQARDYGEFPGYPNGTMALGLREAAKAAGCRVLLAGEGGDEWLGLGRPGYYYAEEMAAGNWRELLKCAREDVRHLGIAGTARWMVRSGIAPLIPEAAKRVAREAQHSGASTTFRRRDWLAPELRVALEVRRARYARARPLVHHRSQRMQVLAYHDPYAVLARESEERSIARQGLELRLPFHDPQIIQFALSTPERIRSLGRTTKRFHRRAMAGLLPDAVLRRTTKADFMTTFRRQLEECEPAFDTICTRRAGWVDPVRAAELAAKRREPGLAGRVEWLLWSLIGCDALV